MKYIFGPILSRRFGKSLGIDLSGETKQCNFDCVYCELDKAKPIDKQFKSPMTDEIIKELKEALKKTQDIDVITITANGEPSLYPNLDELFDKINQIKNKTKTLILSNASTIYDKEIQKTFFKLDKVKLSLDAVDKKIFQKIDRPHKEINIENIISGIKEFKKKFKGDLLIEILFVKNLNDKLEHIKKLNKILKDINPLRIDIGTIDRPPAYKAKALSYEELYNISINFDKDLAINIANRKNIKSSPTYYSKNLILSTLLKRPLTYDDIQILFDKKSQINLEELLKEEKIITKKVENIEFFSLKN